MGSPVLDTQKQQTRKGVPFGFLQASRKEFPEFPKFGGFEHRVSFLEIVFLLSGLFFWGVFFGLGLFPELSFKTRAGWLVGWLAASPASSALLGAGVAYWL